MNVSEYVRVLGLAMTTALGPVAAAATVPPGPATQTASTPRDQAAPASTFDVAARKEVVAKLSEALRDRYIFPEVGERAAARISTALAAGEYDGLTNRSAFIQRLDADVRAIAKDKHLTWHGV